MQIRIMGNKLFQLYLRLGVEKFAQTTNEDQLAKDIVIAQGMIQHAYQAIKSGSIQGNVSELFREAFVQFGNLPGVDQKLK